MTEPRPVIFAPAYYLEANRASLPAALVSAPTLARLQAVAAPLPAASTVALECRLQQGSTRVDFIPQFVLQGGSAAALARNGGKGPAWAAVTRLCTRWADPSSPLCRDVDALWLEFDLDGQATAAPVPSVFVGLARPVRTVGYGPAAEAAVAVLQSELASPSFRRRLAACFVALPPHADLFSLGFMLARAGDAARLCVGHVPTDRLLPYLQEVRWPGPLEMVADLAAELEPLVDEYGVALDLGDDLAPQVGIECYLLESNPRREPRWNRLLEVLVAAGWCTPAKAAALLSWHGRRFHGLAAEEIAELRANAPELAPRHQNLLTRRISHLKIVLDADRPPEAKAYLELNNTWVRYGSEDRRLE